MKDSGHILFALAAFVVGIHLLFVIPKLDRQHIREHIKSHGGKVIEILRGWFAWGSRSARPTR